MPYASHITGPDVVLIGSGVMSANLGAMLKVLDPTLSIQVYESTEELAQESSHGWNNAGTGHAGLCELSYTPTREPDGTVNVANALKIFEQFEYSRQFWSYAVANGLIASPREFINPVAHISFVNGESMVEFLRARHAAMSAHHFFARMQYATDRATIARWAPLLVEGRDPQVPIAATYMPNGTDVNFGALARKLFVWLAAQDRCGIASSHRVIGLKKVDGGWALRIRDLKTGRILTNRAKFVFIGAGGGSLPLLQIAGIAEAKGLGGFPIGGQWLVCDSPEIVRRHQAKVYGQPQPEAPTMAVPHLDTRVLDGKKALLFGPFAAFTTKFLHKTGHRTDLPRSVRLDNIATLINIGLSNLGLVRYLFREGTQSMAARMAILRRFYPEAREEDWKLVDAGIRVQAIKKSDGKAGIVHYGTEVITSADRSIAALLGASPGASVCVSIVLDVIRTCLPSLLSSDAGKARLSAMLPTFGHDIKRAENAERFREMSATASRNLGLDQAEVSSVEESS